MDSAIKVEGLQEAIDMLQQMPKTVVAIGFTRALSAAGNVIADVLQANTPIKSEDVGGLLGKGELRELITVAVQLDTQLRGGSVEVGFGVKGGPISDWLEFGHAMVSHAGNPLGEVKPHPCMRKSADQSMDAAVDAFVESIKETVASQYPQSNVA
jgi:HK97 gp10 family phage protein